MSTDQTFIEYLLDQLQGAQAVGPITYRKMFGEYALYAEGKVFALVCDNQLFIKPTLAGRAVLHEPAEAPPYPGAKLYFLMQDNIEDRELMGRLLRATLRELPLPKPKTTQTTKATRTKPPRGSATGGEGGRGG